MTSMMKFCEDLFRVDRSLMGKGNLETLLYIKEIVPALEISEVPSGFQAYDWTVPEEWRVVEAYIEDLQGNRLIDVKNSNLHVIGYSYSIDQVMEFSDLKNNLYTHKDNDEAIPYLTSYYVKQWGFCLSERQLSQFDTKGIYRVVLKSEHFPGTLHSGEIVLPGETKKEILLSSYICHPSMANNELSGPAVLTALSLWLSNIEKRHFTYRITFHSETLGALVYIKNNEKKLKENVIAGWNFTCMGGPEEITVLPTQYGKSLPDRVTLKALENLGISPKMKNFLHRGSDERQFSSPRLAIPMVSVMKSPYGEYKEYHTSLDDLNFVTEESLNQSLKVMKEVISILESDKYFRQTFIGEAHLSKYDLYESLGISKSEFNSRDILNVMQYCDGTNNLSDISHHTKLHSDLIDRILDLLIEKNIVE